MKEKILFSQSFSESHINSCICLKMSHALDFPVFQSTDSDLGNLRHTHLKTNTNVLNIDITDSALPILLDALLLSFLSSLYASTSHLQRPMLNQSNATFCFHMMLFSSWYG